jgi:hypothetical protein
VVAPRGVRALMALASITVAAVVAVMAAAPLIT